MKRPFYYSEANQIVKNRTFFERQHPLTDDFYLLEELVSHAISEEKKLCLDDLYSIETTTVFLYLKKTHAYYLEKLFPEIDALKSQLIDSKSRDTNKTLVLTYLINTFKKDTEAHIQLENNHFFPVVESWIESGSILFCDWVSIQGFMEQHDDNAQQLSPIIDYLNEYHESNLIGSLLNAKLKVLQADLAIHHQLEEEVLVPRLREYIKKER